MSMSRGSKDSEPAGESDEPMFTAVALDALARDLEAEHGTTEVFSVTLYPGHAVLEVPAEEAGRRMLRYEWNGSLTLLSKGQSRSERIDIRRIQLEVIHRLIGDINSVIDSPDSNYVIVRAPSEDDEGAWVSAYGSNEWSEGGYVAADLDGRIIRRATW